jgi:hypothetical protein
LLRTFVNYVRKKYYNIGTKKKKKNVFIFVDCRNATAHLGQPRSRTRRLRERRENGDNARKRKKRGERERRRKRRDGKRQKQRQRGGERRERRGKTGRGGINTQTSELTFP